MSLSEESEELLGKVRQALEAREQERRRADAHDSERDAACRRMEIAEREVERLRLEMQDAERRVKALEQQVREMDEQGPFYGLGPEPIQAAENQGELCHRDCCNLTPEEISERG